MAETRKPATRTRVVTRPPGQSARAVEADICVVGAGIAGVSAALEAAKLGRRVALVDGLPALGGQAVNSIIGTFCGLFSNGSHGYQLTHGIADGILHDLGEQGVLHYRHGPVTTVVMYDEVALARWIEEAVRKAGITVVLGAVLREVKCHGRRIRELGLATRYGDVRLAATGFVDATGDASVAWGAGLPCREPDEGPLYGTQMVVLEDIDESRQPTRDEMSARLRDKGPAYNLVRHDGFAFVFPGRGTALVNMTHVETPLEPVEASRLALEGKAQADKVVGFIKSEFPEAFGRRARAQLRLSRHPPDALDRRAPAVDGRRRARRHALSRCRRAHRLADRAARPRRTASSGSRSARTICTMCRSAAWFRPRPTTWSRRGAAWTATAPRCRACGSWARASPWAPPPPMRWISPAAAACTSSTSPRSGSGSTTMSTGSSERARPLSGRAMPRRRRG